MRNMLVLWTIMLLTTNVSARDMRLLTYPHPSGVVLGQGWNSVIDYPAPGNCVEFSTQILPHQDKHTEFNETSDSEMLSRSVSYRGSASGSGSFGPFSASASASASRSSFRKRDVATTIVVASATITNGQTFAGPTSTMETTGSGTNVTKAPHVTVGLRETDWTSASQRTEEFLERCGDAFVSAIISGGTLSVVYRLRAASYEERQSFRASASASGSFGGLFGGSASGSFDESIANLRKESRLHIDLVEHGGASTALPVNMQTLVESYGSFSERVAKSPKPVGIIITPYELLPSWPSDSPTVPDEAYRALARLRERLAFLHSAMNDMKRDAQKDLSLDNQYNYAFRSSVGLGFDHLSKTQDAILVVLNGVDTRLKQFASGATCSRGSFQPTCTEPTPEVLDYAFAVLMPLPRNALPNDILAVLEDPKTPVDDKRRLYARFLYRFYVDLPARQRCEVLDECRSNESLGVYRDLITALLAHDDESTRTELPTLVASCLFPADRVRQPTTIDALAACATLKGLQQRALNILGLEASDEESAHEGSITTLFKNPSKAPIGSTTQALLRKYGYSEDLE